MEEQLIVTKGNYGISISIVFIDETEKVLPLTNKSVSIVFVNEEGKYSKEAFISDTENGIASVVLTEEDTETLGLTMMYWTVYDDNSKITAQGQTNYYVIQEDGGK